MYKTLEEHEVQLQQHGEVIHQDILPRLEILEKEHLVFKQEMTSIKSDLMGVQKGQKDLEVTVMKDGKETRELLKPFADHVLKQVEYEAETEREIQIKKLDLKGKVTVAIYGAIGSGGIATIILGILALFKAFLK
ncbi:hypothetical protein [Rummeliibacillus stabekisii]|uniref:Uncharacterized protein n=1 Tax=Rummeliibacillus stabekisii TaxID=241244 RepID=A0A143HCJ3_9BACL|nr:hypothetical protein [Rummeliibacillus stabekisii]AMW99196.1 hypothetical protein ATY39_06800 [Rummeliibacillus stabekisii]